MEEETRAFGDRLKGTFADERRIGALLPEERHPWGLLPRQNTAVLGIRGARGGGGDVLPCPLA